jgi:hypothetical protein
MRAALVGRCTWFTEPFPDRSTGGPRSMAGETAAPRPRPNCGTLPPAAPASTLPLSGRAPGVDGMLWRREARRLSSASVRLSKFCCALEWSIVQGCTSLHDGRTPSLGFVCPFDKKRTQQIPPYGEGCQMTTSTASAIARWQVSTAGSRWCGGTSGSGPSELRTRRPCCAWPTRWAMANLPGIRSITPAHSRTQTSTHPLTHSARTPGRMQR